jgi:hypothetical protein
LSEVITRCFAAPLQVYGNAVPYAEEGRHFGLEFLDKRTVVREPPAVQYLVDARQEPLTVSDVGPADVNGRVEQGRSAKHRKLGKVGFHPRHRLKIKHSIPVPFQ